MTDTELTQAELFDVFSNARRRRTVRYLTRRGGSCDLAPLVEQVAAWENDVDRDEVTRTQRRRVYISLYQTHLPMLEDNGIVDWNADDHTIELLPNEELFEPYLDRRLDGQRPWHRVYAGVTTLGIVALALSWLSVGPVSAAVAPAIALVLSVIVLAVSVAQHVERRPGSMGTTIGVGR
ncbi:ClbS/DfsB family four-helix bundle protein [Halosolutus gelatinilyticus]|uniref:ClbS/DfsB family four-helix bundle protein n=1 Tax=Halosolutus gelatinilyticus TaxID=2931975 RepID=UPI001FF35D1E|nr:ClbS/DfsB family four-helix bundle protein [Halosolutus gelatinilyticus]